MRTLIALAALSAASFASAQIATPTNLSLRLGAAYPLDNTTRDNIRSFIGVGFDYFFQNSLLPGGETYLSGDWLGKASSGDKGNMFPFCINQRWYNKGAELDYGRKSYFFLGAGVAIIDVTSTKTVLAGRAGYGMEFGEHIFGELTFVISDDAHGARANSIGGYIGYRF